MEVILVIISDFIMITNRQKDQIAREIVRAKYRPRVLTLYRQLLQS